MIADLQHGQRIARLTPLADALAAIDALVRPVQTREAAVAAALGRVLGADAVVANSRPVRALALRDGWAIRSEETADAGSYAPAILAALPARIDTGEPLPAGTDAVAPLEGISFHGQRAQATAPVAPGEGVLPVGADAAAGKPLRRSGQRLRSIDCAVLLAADVSRVTIREPRIRLVRSRAPGNAVIDACYAWIARAIEAEGALGILDPEDEPATNPLEAALRHEASDAVIVLGGTGNGCADTSVRTLAQAGRVEFHGVGLLPGDTAAFGFAGARPVLLLPGRIDSALAAWLVIGRRWLDRLAPRDEEETPVMAELARKVVSTVGVAEVVPMTLRDGVATPLGRGYLSFSALARADGWILVAADSEGHPAGARVAVRPLT